MKIKMFLSEWLKWQIGRIWFNLKLRLIGWRAWFQIKFRGYPKLPVNKIKNWLNKLYGFLFKRISSIDVKIGRSKPSFGSNTYSEVNIRVKGYSLEEIKEFQKEGQELVNSHLKVWHDNEQRQFEKVRIEQENKIQKEHDLKRGR